MCLWRHQKIFISLKLSVWSNWLLVTSLLTWAQLKINLDFLSENPSLGTNLSTSNSTVSSVALAMLRDLINKEICGYMQLCVAWNAVLELQRWEHSCLLTLSQYSALFKVVYMHLSFFSPQSSWLLWGQAKALQLASLPWVFDGFFDLFWDGGGGVFCFALLLTTSYNARKTYYWLLLLYRR